MLRTTTTFGLTAATAEIKRVLPAGELQAEVLVVAAAVDALGAVVEGEDHDLLRGLAAAAAAAIDCACQSGGTHSKRTDSGSVELA